MTNSGALRPRLVVDDAAKAIDYYLNVFGADEIVRYGDSGMIVHAELSVFGATMTLKDEDATDKAPTSAGGSSPTLLMLDVDDVDAVGERMVAAGGTVIFPIGDSEQGRGGRIEDPFGHVWMISQRFREPAVPTQNGHTHTDLWSMVDLQTPWCVYVVATLKIADHIAAGINDIDRLAAAAKCDTEALHAVLGYLITKGLFEEPEPGRFTLNDGARQLLDPSQFLDLNGIGGRMAYAWSTLPTYVRTGKPGYHEVFGMPFWEDLAAHPDVAASFDAMIGRDGHGTPSGRFAITGGWDDVRTVIDVGGGTGSLLAEVLRLHPQLHGTLVDLPGTVARAAEIFQAAGVADRVSAVGQSFFDPLPADADLYTIKGVLNDWPAVDQVRILRRCAEAAGPDGRIAILLGASPEGPQHRLTVEMMLLAGEHASLDEFREYTRQAGLDIIATGKPDGSDYYVIECRPVTAPDSLR